MHIFKMLKILKMYVAKYERQVKLFEMNSFAMFITALCVIFPGYFSYETSMAEEQESLRRKLVIFLLENKFLCHVFNSA